MSSPNHIVQVFVGRDAKRPHIHRWSGVRRSRSLTQNYHCFRIDMKLGFIHPQIVFLSCRMAPFRAHPSRPAARPTRSWWWRWSGRCWPSRSTSSGRPRSGTRATRSLRSRPEAETTTPSHPRSCRRRAMKTVMILIMRCPLFLVMCNLGKLTECSGYRIWRHFDFMSEIHWMKCDRKPGHWLIKREAHKHTHRKRI